MKPIYLKMTAFGSYCGTAEVDFTKLYDNGIFLITGKTGGGKTTILDAMCMALYGMATGSDRAKEWRQMRCGNAPQDVDTELEYIFFIDRTKYKFYRRWRVPKTKNGEFRVDDKENACYIQRENSDEWEPIATSRAAVNAAAEDILKLTQSQFVKVIMLPQGEFRELLTASSDEKEDIFKKLFDTQRWEKISAKISEEFRRLEGECKSHNDARSAALSAAECDSEDALKEKISQCEASLSELSKQAEQNFKKTEQTAAELKSAEDTAALFRSLNKQKAALENLNTQIGEYNQLSQTLAHSRKLRGVLPQFNLMKAAQSAKANAEVSLKSAQTAERAAQSQLVEAQKKSQQIPALEKQRKQILTDLANLSTLSKNHADFDQTSRRLSENKRALKSANEHLIILREAKATLEAQINTGKEYLEGCHTATQNLNSANEKCRELGEICAALDNLNIKIARQKEVSKLAADNQKEIEAEEKQLRSLETVKNAVENAILSDKAYSLAVKLEEGAPCPVCGSIHHPTPAAPSDSVPHADELELCRGSVEKSKAKLEKLRTEGSAYSAELNVLDKDISQLKQNLGENSNLEISQVKSELDISKKQTAELQKRSRQTAAANERLKQRETELAANARDIENAVTHINNLNIQISSDEQKINSITEQLHTHAIESFKELDEKVGSFKQSLSDAEANIKALNLALTEASSSHVRAKATLTSADERLTAASAELQSRLEEFRTKCGELGISESTNIEGGVLSDRLEGEYDKKISAYKQQCDFAHRRIDELTSQLGEKSLPDVEALRAANASAIAEGQSIARQSGNIMTQLDSLKNLAKTIADEDAALENLSKNYETARRMNQLFSGQNEARTPIHQYVIGIKMDEVIMSANLYMYRLTKGQYAMKRKESAGGRAKHQGLDIEILDSSAGKVRPVSTLSGGELFLASLSLAFGLSDVVQSFAGGIHLDSLFIDEGFGSLDSETLDTAIEAITQVRENKLLGIISHVSELKERIPCGIEVIKTPEGSTLKMRI